ncbi:sensor histidine kinase [Parasphingopyxis marina]|uniref:histidine kinase n=1 Tax=Parasphingopyxis marina TaxID=2761622 RepID=A0A842HYJ1_9SPHN|nr:ATP-binding protein [Parasphingopyxis marina]MBC2777905.1 sensor N-terminal transmembrane domain-containing protein [Parasphingopyxis marina]
MSVRDDLALKWSARWSLTSRILAVNIIALGLLAGSFFWLDSYRVRLLDERARQTETQAHIIGTVMSRADSPERAELAVRMGNRSGNRIRVYGADGVLMLDSWALAEPTYTNRDPATEPWRRHVARAMDAGIEALVGADELPPFREPDSDRRSAWPVAEAVALGVPGAVEIGLAPDRTPMVSAAVPLGNIPEGVLLLTGNARDIRGDVRDERLRLGIIVLAAAIISILLSLFMARTIVRPLRRLSIAAQRVRLGRAREVDVPRLPSRRDEIGLLARALSDMSQALRKRIDATEAFAADVAHELKNPLASLHSAVDSLERIDDPALQKQLLDVVKDDVRRLDRLVTEISDASRIDAELSRSNFDPVDMGEVIGSIVAARDQRGLNRNVRIAFGRPRKGSAQVMGDASQLARVLENLLDNAVSFSPENGTVRITATNDGEHVLIKVEDEGPGVPEDVREEIFRRFHSLRPESDGFGNHSGLGLAIAKAIIEGHDGTITVEDRHDSASGARFIIKLPMAQP